MPYTIQAIIGKSPTIQSSDIEGKYIVNLSQGLSMIPLVEEYREVHGMPFLPMTDEGLEQIPESIGNLCSILSSKGRIAYIEAEFHGGKGMQASALWQNGAMILEPIISLNAINEALIFLGAEESGEMDHFDSVGLANNRNTEQWLE